ncbi:MAG: hypothetical protein WCF77_03205 [Minisyncoccia bacterium]
MIDPELEQDLEKIDAKLSHMDKVTSGTWRTLWRGIIYGAGYVIGAIIIIVVVGWILDVVGIIPALNNQVAEFRMALQHIGATVK